MDRQLLRQKVRQKISVIKTNTLFFNVFNTKWTIFVSSSQLFVLITDIFWRTFWRNNWKSIIDVVERLCHYIQNFQKISFSHWYFRTAFWHTKNLPSLSTLAFMMIYPSVSPRKTRLFFRPLRLAVKETLCLFVLHGWSQCARMDLNKRFLPKPMTTTGWKGTP